MNEAIHDILEGDEIDKVIDDCSQRPSCIYAYHVNNTNPPKFDDIDMYFEPEESKYLNQHSSKYEDELRKVS